MNEIDDEGLDLVGIYHSHVSSPAYPSRTDAEQAFWPEAIYVIVSLAGAGADVRGFRSPTWTSPKSRSRSTLSGQAAPDCATSSSTTGIGVTRAPLELGR